MASALTLPKCKSTADEEARFCGGCGIAVPAPAPTPARPRRLDELLDRASGGPKAVPHVSPAMGVPIPVAAARSGPVSGPTPSPLSREPVAGSLDSLQGRTLNNPYSLHRKQAGV